MTFAELISTVTWVELKAALVWLFPEEKHSLPDYKKLFRELRRMKPEPSSMRIAIEYWPMPGESEDQTPQVHGRDGSLNRDQADFRHWADSATPEYAAAETVWSLCMRPWPEWLGMSVEPEALATYSPAQAVAYCLNEMTFHGFDEADIREFNDELQRRVDEIHAMTEEEKAERLIPAEQVFAEMREKLGLDD